MRTTMRTSFSLLFLCLFHSQSQSQSQSQRFLQIGTDCNLNENSLLECYQKCRIVYKGLKNYFNQTSQMCMPVINCSDSQSYDYLTNTCSELLPDFSSYPNQTISSVTNTTSSNVQLIVPTINCVNGYMPVNSTICICYAGWSDNITSTNTGANYEVINKCYKVLENFSNQTNTNTTNNTTEGNYSSTSSVIITDNTTGTTDSLPEFYKIVIIVSSSLVACCLICIFIFCFRCKKSKEKDSKINYSNPIVPVMYMPNNAFMTTNRDQINYTNNNCNRPEINKEIYVVENPERVNRQLTFQTPIKKKGLTNNRSSNKIRYCRSDINNLKHNRNYYDDSEYDYYKNQLKYRESEIISDFDDIEDEQVCIENSIPHLNQFYYRTNNEIENNNYDVEDPYNSYNNNYFYNQNNPNYSNYPSNHGRVNTYNNISSSYHTPNTNRRRNSSHDISSNRRIINTPNPFKSYMRKF